MLSKALLVKVTAVLGTAIVAGGIAFALTGDGPVAADAGPARAWVDDPLDGEVVVPGPVAIVAHAYDPDGVTEMTLVVDGVTVETTVPDRAGEVLASAQWAWVANEGIHVIEVIGRGLEDGEGLAGRAVIEVRFPGSLLEPTTTTTTTTTTPTTTTTTTPTTTTTTTPTTTTTTPTTTTTTVADTTTTTEPCTPPSPLLFEPEDGFSTEGPVVSITFDWGVLLTPPICAPSGYFVEISTDEDFTTVVISEHFEASTTEWTPPETTWGCNVFYYWRVWSKRSDGSLAAVSTTREFNVFCVG